MDKIQKRMKERKNNLKSTKSEGSWLINELFTFSHLFAQSSCAHKIRKMIIWNFSFDILFSDKFGDSLIILTKIHNLILD